MNEDKRRIVLYVEDEPLFQLGLEGRIEQTGLPIRLLQAENQEDGERLLIDHLGELDAIIIDGCVPGSRFNTAALIRKARSLFHGPIIAVSVSHGAEQIKAGCTHQCEKSSLRILEKLQTLLSL